MSSQLFSIAPRLARFSAHMAHSPRSAGDPQHDLEALLARMAQRRYPETIPVLASYWLKTVYSAGHKLPWWKELNRILKQTLAEQELSDLSREALHDIQSWIEQTVLPAGKVPPAPPPRSQPYRANLRPERLKAYVRRLLNQWLSSEIAWLLVNESAPGDPQEGGIPVLAIAKALERLVARESLSPEMLEMLLNYEPLSPRDVYPADLEILADVVLAKLGRTRAPAAAVMPARLLALPEGSSLPPDYGEAVRQAALIESPESETIHVPITPKQALQILEREPVRIGSILVTMDGRWWEPKNLQSGGHHAVVYRPAGRLRIDYTADHAKLHVPWPEARWQWSGGVHFAERFEIFGREWHASSWETDGERSWLHLEFSRSLPVEEQELSVDKPFRRSSPAVVDMAWAALENALADAVSSKSREPIEQLRRSEMIPLGRALFGFAEAVANRWLPNREAIEAQLRAIRYLEAENSQRYGRVPWKILPATVQSAFVRKRPDSAMMELVEGAFVELPPALGRNPAQAGPTSPSQAA
jgi:hypothetical protein